MKQRIWFAALHPKFEIAQKIIQIIQDNYNNYCDKINRN